MMRPKLKNWLSWQPQPKEVLALMRPVKPWPVQMELFSRGIDNARVDVNLSPRFVARTRALVQVMVRQDVATHYWNKMERQPRPRDLEEFCAGYRGLVDGALKQRQQVPPTDWVRLVQLSLLKFLLQLVPEQIHSLRSHLEAGRDGAKAQLSGQRLEYHERLVVLARQESAIAYRVFQRLFKLVEKEESMQLRKLRKSLLGVSWPVPREALFNALLQLPNLLAEEEVVHHYPMLCVEDNVWSYLDGFNRCLCEVFKDYLPTWVRPKAPRSVDAEAEARKGGGAAGGGFRVMDRLDQGGLRGFLETEIVLSHLLAEEEYKTPRYSWLDDPENLQQLLAGRPAADKCAGGADDRASSHWRDYRSAVREELIRRIERLDIMPRITASYWTPRIFLQLSEQVSARLIYDYLTGRCSKLKILRQLAAAHVELDPARVVKTLDFAAAEIKQLRRDRRREYVLPVLHDFLRLRRDLKLAYKTFEAMDQIRILTDADDVNLSRANGLLYEFNLEDEQTAEERIRNHVILKADVRGSTRITSELRAKKLNPATHFSQNFFNPINAYLADFGAGKVFVEGDAVILSFLEYTNSAQRRLGVAHACGMASRILEVVARQNALNRRHGLPELELGLGIAFSDEEPTFLYDGDQQIMISPAINLADRLSSCAKVLRTAEFAENVRPFRVEVLLPVESADLPASLKTDVVRYNVNGIEMDTAAFSKLKSELAMQCMDVKVAGCVTRFHVGRYPDLNGRMQWLVVREAPMHLWERGEGPEQQAPGRRFFEVVVEPSLITLLRSKLRSGAERGAAVSRVADSS
jgi:class 3 adenylate cyclase